MFSIFKASKNTPSTLFPPGFVDIHAHVLPGLDDGASDMEQSIDLIKRMSRAGIKNLIATPHIMEGVWPNNAEVILQTLKLVENRLQQEGLNDIRISAAAEYLLDHSFSQRVEAEELLTLKNRHVLVEMSYVSAPINLYELLFEMQVKDYLPVLAHPERYNFLHRDMKSYYKLKDAGCSFQLNLLSLTPYYGKQVQNIASKLIKENLIDFVGTDTHHERHLEELEKINDFKMFRKIESLLHNNGQFFF